MYMEYILKNERITGSLSELVTGPNRYQYFKWPMIPVLQSVPHEVVQDIPEQKILAAKITAEEEAKFHHVEI